MGLDMYLEKEIYIGAEYEHRQVEGTIFITLAGKKVDVDFKKVSKIVERVGYWRKANAIHAWFVENVQQGVDDCNRYYVHSGDLKRLWEVCHELLKTKSEEEAKQKLPPQEGFFFGGTSINEYYWQDLEETVKIIDSLDLDDGDYYYQSSW
jgi:hypothetical protein